MNPPSVALPYQLGKLDAPFPVHLLDEFEQAAMVGSVTSDDIGCCSWAMSRSLRRSEKDLAGKGFFMAIRVNGCILENSVDIAQRYTIFLNRTHSDERKDAGEKRAFFGSLFRCYEAPTTKANPKADFPYRCFAGWPGMRNFVVSGWW
jgi:hypothetical protein